MKVIFSCSLPFFLAHGGSQTLTEALMRELSNLGVEVEPAKWWDGNQTGDILHFIGRPSTFTVRLAQQKGFKVLMTDLLDQTASRSRGRLFLQRAVTRLLKNVIPKVTGQLNWEVYQELDAMVYAVPHEWVVAKYLFDATPTRGHIVPHGLTEGTLQGLSCAQKEEDYLVSVATIHPRKNTVLLAEAAREAKVPVVFIGKPYAESDPYFLRFQNLIDDRYVRYPGFVSEEEKYSYLRGARGFVLLSQFESGCVAVFEAAGAGLPLLLSDKPWATKGYPKARNLHFAKLDGAARIAPIVARFYQQAHRQSATTFPVFSWREVARQYLDIYEKLVFH